MNSNTLVETRDIGKDGEVGNPDRENIAADVYGYSLGYYTNDYNPIVTPTDHFLATEPGFLANEDLFNGNIRSMVTAIRKPDGTMLENTPNVYTYDQLHRIKNMQKYSVIDEATNSWANASALLDYNASYFYDPNGNLDSLFRRDQNNLIDKLRYDYYPGTNQLELVDDPMGSTVGDVDAQSSDNYVYDGSGNLIKDLSENTEDIEWNQYGKIKQVTRNGMANLAEQPNVSYQYDAMGNRVLKRVQKGTTATDWTYTYYARDADGNVMAVYTGKDNTQTDSDQMEDFFEKEFHLYGSKRLGIKQSDHPDQDLESYALPTGVTERIAGKRSYELSNHLGNVPFCCFR